MKDKFKEIKFGIYEHTDFLDDGNCCEVEIHFQDSKHFNDSDFNCHFIEYAAYDQLKQDLEACIEVMEFLYNIKHPMAIYEIQMVLHQTLSKLKHKRIINDSRRGHKTVNRC